MLRSIVLGSLFHNESFQILLITKKEEEEERKGLTAAKPSVARSVVQVMWLWAMGLATEALLVVLQHPVSLSMLRMIIPAMEMEI